MSNLVTETPATLPAVVIPPATETARHAMVLALKEYLSTIKFRRPGEMGEEFYIPKKNILEEWPDPEKKLSYPSLCIPDGEGELQTLGLTPQVDESSFNRWSPSTALVQIAEYVETIQLTIFAADKPERRCIMAALHVAFSPSENSGFRLRTSAAYYEREAAFLLTRERLVEDEAIRNQRRADMFLLGRIPDVRLMAFKVLVPSAEVEVTEVVSVEVVNEQGGVIIATTPCHTEE